MSDLNLKNKHDVARMKIGEIIAETRLDKNMTQRQLADKIGMKQSRLASIERGNVNFTIDTALDIADALDVGVDYIFLKALWNGKTIKVDADTKDCITRNIVTSIVKSLK